MKKQRQTKPSAFSFHSRATYLLQGFPFSGSFFQAMAKNTRQDHTGTHRRQFEINKKKIYSSQTRCALCGKEVDFSLKFPHPMSATVDHIIPIHKGGHPSDMDNLQLAHLSCNRAKSDKIVAEKFRSTGADEVVSNRNLPQSMDWSTYRHR